MAVPKSLSFLRLGNGPQVIEVYLDLICPFSAKMAKSLSANVIPLTNKGGKYEKELSVIIRPYAQPFHYLAAHHTEAVIVFGQQYPDLFWDYFNAVFDEIDTFKNGPGGDLTGNQVRDKLTDIALKVLEDNKRLSSGPKSKAFGEFRSRLSPDPKGNGGNEGTEGFKHNIKIGRQNGIHVTPTVLFDGLKEDSVSSSWGKEDWDKFLSEIQGLTARNTEGSSSLIEPSDGDEKSEEQS